MMKKAHSFAIILLMAVLFTSCEKNGIDFSSEFQKSFRTWLDFKASSGNSYRYTIEFGSWVGFSTETTITIQSGKPTHRSYVRRARDQNNAIVIQEQWEEDESTLNTHEYGAAPITLDAIYSKARTDWLQKRENATSFFEAKNAGMISTCGYVPSACADDCFTGIHISSIERL